MRILVKHTGKAQKIEVRTWFTEFMKADFILAHHPDRTLAMKLYRATTEGGMK